MTANVAESSLGKIDAEMFRAVHPGGILKNEFLDTLGISIYRLAHDIKVDEGRIHQIVKGERNITPDTAARFALFFGTTTNFWLNLQATTTPMWHRIPQHPLRDFHAPLLYNRKRPEGITMLDLAPEIERTVRDTAAREGVSINEVVARKFAPAQLTKAAVEPVEDPIWALLREQIAEVASATAEEIAADELGYREWQQNMDAPRRANGERLLFPDVPPLP